MRYPRKDTKWKTRTRWRKASRRKASRWNSERVREKGTIRSLAVLVLSVHCPGKLPRNRPVHHCAKFPLNSKFSRVSNRFPATRTPRGFPGSASSTYLGLPNFRIPLPTRMLPELFNAVEHRIPCIRRINEDAVIIFASLLPIL